MVLIPVSCPMSWTSIHSSSGTVSIRSSPLNLFLKRKGPPKITRGTSLQTTRRQVFSFCPTCQLNNAQGAQRHQLAQPVQWRGTYPGEDWQMDFTQMPVSQGYKYLLVMIDTFTGWIEGFPTRTEKAKEVVKKKKKNCSMKSFWDLVSPGH